MAGFAALPGGVWHEGRRHCQARLRPLNGADEAFLSEEGGAWTPAERSTALLTRALEQLGPWLEVTPEAARALTVGDREALLLQLRRLTFGDRMECVFGCPGEGCGERLEISLSVSDLLLPRYADWRPTYEAELQDDDGTYAIIFRLPTGADQEAVAKQALRDVDSAAHALLEACVESVTDKADGKRRLPAEWPRCVSVEIPPLLATLDSQAELTILMACPDCGHEFSALLDAGAILAEEIGARPQRLLREVHLLALHYHWSEADILAMTLPKRRKYLGLLAESVGAESGT